jgi:hypothetical protein
MSVTEVIVEGALIAAHAKADLDANTSLDYRTLPHSTDPGSAVEGTHTKEGTGHGTLSRSSAVAYRLADFERLLLVGR